MSFRVSTQGVDIQENNPTTFNGDLPSVRVLLKDVAVFTAPLKTLPAGGYELITLTHETPYHMEIPATTSCIATKTQSLVYNGSKMWVTWKWYPYQMKNTYAGVTTDTYIGFNSYREIDREAEVIRTYLIYEYNNAFSTIAQTFGEHILYIPVILVAF